MNGVSRKLILAAVLLVISAVAMFMGKITADQWMGFSKWVLGIYSGGNVGEWIAKAIKKV